MIPETVKCPNPSFDAWSYTANQNNYAVIYSDLMTGSVRYTLNDGERQYDVPKEVFQLWLDAYESGRELR